MDTRALLQSRLTREDLERLPEAPAAFAPVMLASLEHEPFDDAQWLYERKLDGERCLIVKNKEGVRLYSRNETSLNRTYPELVEALAAQPVEAFVLDGEIVTFEDGVTSFSRLQARMQLKDEEHARRSDVAVFLYCFDLLNADGRVLESLPLSRRKSVLKDLLRWEDPLRFTLHRNANGLEYLEEACRKGWEGLLAKDRRSQYIHSRSRAWRKFKCVARQEFVIGGCTLPQGERVGLGAILVGYFEEDEFRYAGKVGTGFDDATLLRLRERLDDLVRDQPPFASRDKKELPSSDVVWAEPALVCEIGFTEWTASGKLRHPRFLGLRRDKAPGEVTREDTRRSAS